MASLVDMALSIIREQELVIGPMAWSEAAKVQGLRVQTDTKQLAFSEGDQKLVIDRLVGQYERLFGRASQEVCKEAVAALIAQLPRTEVPVSLLS